MTLVHACTLLLLSAPSPFSQQLEKAIEKPSMVLYFQQPATPTPPRQDKPEVNSSIQSNLRAVFSGDPVLDGAAIEPSVDDAAITLTGTVQSEGQHRRALELVSQYSRYRKIVDKLVVK